MVLIFECNITEVPVLQRNTGDQCRTQGGAWGHVPPKEGVSAIKKFVHALYDIASIR